MSNNKVVKIDLKNKNIEIEEIPIDIIEKYIGGKGLAAYHLYYKSVPKIDPFDPENKLVIFNGPFTGLLPGFSRHVIASKSPLTNTFCDSYSGGWFGYELSKTGYIGIEIEGKADTLSLIKIDDDEVTIENAENLRGLNTGEVDNQFKDYRVLTIGPAGEKLVRFACIVNDYSKKGRTGVAGRGGLGAVMGSKNLKAIIVKGSKSPTKYLDNELKSRLKEIRNDLIDYMVNEVAQGICMGGNLPAVEMSARAKIIPVRNYRGGTVENYKLIDGEAFQKLKVNNNTCYLCPLACGLHVKIDDGKFKGLEIDRIEYETVVMNGPNCGQMDVGTIAMVNKLCNDYGMDTISVGNINSFVMECSEKNLLDYKIDYGDNDKQIEFIHSIARREGIGDIFAEGLKRASEKLGLEDIAVHIKGLEIPGYDVRAPVGMALAYATADRGGDHLRAWTVIHELDHLFSTDNKPKNVKEHQDRNAALWTLIGCDNIPANTITDPTKFVDLSIKALNEFFWKNEFGYELDRESFFKIGERIYNITRLVNVREGISRKDDNLPKRLKEPREDTGWEIKDSDFTKMLNEYYKLRGWDENGIPETSTLRSLGIEDV